jgi:hypothetical protein
MQQIIFDQPTKEIPFSLKGYHGKVSVYYGLNDNPQKVGFDSLLDIGFDPQLSLGYPVIQARIEHYGGNGYRMFCGWIQIITSVYRDSRDPQVSASQTFVSVDTAPAFDKTGIPFAVYGYLPQLFDAPCRNLGAAAELRWTADTFLTSVPLRSRTEEISWLAGFRWGYTENDIPGTKPSLFKLEVTAAQAWNAHLSFLHQQFRDWRFKEFAK